jgi:hypothetical protein
MALEIRKRVFAINEPIKVTSLLRRRNLRAAARSHHADASQHAPQLTQARRTEGLGVAPVVRQRASDHFHNQPIGTAQQAVMLGVDLGQLDPGQRRRKCPDAPEDRQAGLIVQVRLAFFCFYSALDFSALRRLIEGLLSAF